MHVGMAGKKDLQLSIVQGPEARSVSNTWEKEVSIAVETPEGEAFGSTALKLRFFGQKSCIDVTESSVCTALNLWCAHCSPPCKNAFSIKSQIRIFIIAGIDLISDVSIGIVGLAASSISVDITSVGSDSESATLIQLIGSVSS